MTPSREREIIARCPSLFDVKPGQSGEAFRCGDGWAQLLDDLVVQLAALAAQLPPSERPRIVEVKEKFGQIRVYLSDHTDELDAAIAVAKKRSLVTCEACGAPGRLVGDRWVLVLCESCERTGAVP